MLQQYGRNRRERHCSLSSKQYEEGVQKMQEVGEQVERYWVECCEAGLLHLLGRANPGVVLVHQQYVCEQVAKNAKQIKQEERQAIVNAGGKQALKIADIILRDERNKKRTSGSDEVFQLSGWVALASMLSLAAVLVVIIYIGTKAIIRRTGCCARSEANRKNVTYNTV